MQHDTWCTKTHLQKTLQKCKEVCGKSHWSLLIKHDEFLCINHLRSHVVMLNSADSVLFFRMWSSLGLLPYSKPPPAMIPHILLNLLLHPRRWCDGHVTYEKINTVWVFFFSVLYYYWKNASLRINKNHYIYIQIVQLQQSQNQVSTKHIYSQIISFSIFVFF